MKTAFPAKRLDLEITEGVLISDNDSAYELIAQLKSLGVSISMDDFGTGYSSLSYIHAFPFDKLKIDRSFVSTEKHNKKKEAIIRAAVGLGASLGMRVNAEGVETQEQSLRLQRLGCDEAQGYLFSPAVPAHDIPALIDSGFADKVRPIRNTNIFRFN